MKPIIINCSVPDKLLANELSHDLVSKGLVKCAQIVGPITSIYEWEGKIEEGSEFLLIFKGKEENYPEIEKVILTKHPYKVPEIIVTDISHGFKNYLDWINKP